MEKIFIVSPILIKVWLASSIYEDQYINIKLSNEALRETVKLFTNTFRYSNPDKTEFYNIVYEDLKYQEYNKLLNLDAYFIKDIEVIDGN